MDNKYGSPEIIDWLQDQGYSMYEFDILETATKHLNLEIIKHLYTKNDCLKQYSAHLLLLASFSYINNPLKVKDFSYYNVINYFITIKQTVILNEIDIVKHAVNSQCNNTLKLILNALIKKQKLV